VFLKGEHPWKVEEYGWAVVLARTSCVVITEDGGTRSGVNGHHLEEEGRYKPGVPGVSGWSRRRRSKRRRNTLAIWNSNGKSPLPSR
jgi:hypothetical protein